VPAALVGADMQFVYGKHSGVAAIESALRKNDRRLAAAGVAVDGALCKRVLEEVKRVREERAAAQQGSVAVAQYYDNLQHLGLTEDDVVRIAEGIGPRRDAAASIH